MKSIRLIALLVLSVLLLSIPVMALSAATGVAGNASVAADGSCRIQMTLTLRLEESRSDLLFPLPKDADQVLVGGQKAETSQKNGLLKVQLPTYSAGKHTLLLQYDLPCVVKKTGGRTVVNISLLNGFTLPIESLQFSLTLPGEITAQPVFTSGYHQENVAFTADILENTLQATLSQPLKDHETLTMQLPVDKSLFDDNVKKAPIIGVWDGILLALTLLAMLYFCLMLMPKIPRQRRYYTPPEGICAGEVGCCLTGCGTDLGLTVVSWAQAGYLVIERDRKGRILLHKRMDMGNERSYHEGRIFQILFSRRNIVDATGPNFGRLCWKVSGRSPILKQIYSRRSGNPILFRGLCCGAAFCCGVGMIGFSFVGVLLGIFAAALGWFIQSGGKCLPLRNKLPLLIAIACGGLWILLGVATDSLVRVIPTVIFQYLAGIFAAYGGKRSEMGTQVLTQLLGLRRHMSGTGSFEMQALQQKNPDYFYELAPYALAMGVQRQFVRRFDSRTALPDCFWLKNAPAMTPQQWMACLREMVDDMNKSRYQNPKKKHRA